MYASDRSLEMMGFIIAVILLWLLFMITSPSKANDGQVGQTSTATVRISITIPERVRTVTPDGTPIITNYEEYEIKKNKEGVFIVQPRTE